MRGHGLLSRRGRIGTRNRWGREDEIRIRHKVHRGGRRVHVHAADVEVVEAIDVMGGEGDSSHSKSSRG